LGCPDRVWVNARRAPQDDRVLLRLNHIQIEYRKKVRLAFLALAEGLVEENSGSGGGVEAFDVRSHGDVDAGVSGMDDVLREAGAFVADEESDGLTPVHLPGGERSGGFFADAGSERVDAVEFELREKNRERHSGDDREMQRGARGGAEGLGRVGAGGAALTGGGSDGSGGAKGSGGAQDGADVAGVLNAGENDEERSAGAGGRGEDFIEREFTGLDESGDALGMFGVGDAFKEAIGGAEDGEAGVRTADERGEAFAVAFAGFAEEDGLNAAGGAESFFDEACAFDADRTVFGGKAAAESDAKLLEPAVVAAGKEVGGDGGGFGSRGHCRKVSKSAGGKAMGVEGYQRADISDQEARKGLHGGHRERRVRREEKSKRVAIGYDSAAIPPLRGPTRQKAARKEKSGPALRDREDTMVVGKRRGPLVGRTEQEKWESSRG